jgi:hypothetical protein
MNFRLMDHRRSWTYLKIFVVYAWTSRRCEACGHCIEDLCTRIVMISSRKCSQIWWSFWDTKQYESVFFKYHNDKRQEHHTVFIPSYLEICTFVKKTSWCFLMPLKDKFILAWVGCLKNKKNKETMTFSKQRRLASKCCSSYYFFGRTKKPFFKFRPIFISSWLTE